MTVNLVVPRGRLQSIVIALGRKLIVSIVSLILMFDFYGCKVTTKLAMPKYSKIMILIPCYRYETLLQSLKIVIRHTL
jgi:hypothetical protein